MKACLKFFLIFLRNTFAIIICGNLSVRLILADVPNDQNRRLTNFLSVACSFKLLFRAAVLGVLSHVSK